MKPTDTKNLKPTFYLIELELNYLLSIDLPTFQNDKIEIEAKSRGLSVLAHTSSPVRDLLDIPRLQQALRC